jgi:hypothetical protein
MALRERPTTRASSVNSVHVESVSVKVRIFALREALGRLVRSAVFFFAIAPKATTHLRAAQPALQETASPVAPQCASEPIPSRARSASQSS